MGKKKDKEEKSAEELRADFAAALELYKYPDTYGDWTATLPDDDAQNRYIRARKGDAEAAVKQYVEAEWFFKQQQVEGMLEIKDDNEHVYSATCPVMNAGFGREGEPIYWERTGAIDQGRLLKLLHPMDLIRRHVRQQQKALRRMEGKQKEIGKLVEKQIIVCDLKGMSMWPHRAAMKVFKETIRIDQAYYPERLKCLYMINAPWIFRPVWAIIRPWLAPVTQAKFHILGGGYKESLLSNIDEANIPEEYGGTMEPGLPELVPLTKEQEKACVRRVKDIKKGRKNSEFKGLEYDEDAAVPEGPDDAEGADDAEGNEAEAEAEDKPAEEQGLFARVTTWL